MWISTVMGEKEEEGLDHAVGNAIKAAPLAVLVAEGAARARQTVEALGTAIHAAQVDASAPLARSVQAEQNLYDAIDREFGLLSSAQAGHRMGSRAAASRNTALAAHREGRLLSLVRGRYRLFPGFQFDVRGVRPVVAELASLGAELGWGETGLIQWLVSPTTYLGGRRPVDVLEDPDRMLAAARAALAVQW